MNKLLIAFLLLSMAFATPFQMLDRVFSKYPNIKSIDELIEKVPMEFRENWTAVYKSNGLTRSITSPENPRVIMFSNDSKLIFTFANCQGETEEYPLCEKLEALDFDESENKWKLKLYALPGKNSNKEVFTRVNPRGCMNCHGVDIKPIWEPYNYWIGVYGSIGNDKEEIMAKGSKELFYYQKFTEKHWKRADGSKRYKSLVLRETKATTTYTPTGFGKNQAPNKELTLKLYNQHFKKMAKDLWESHTDLKEKLLLTWWSRCFRAIDGSRYNARKWEMDSEIDFFAQHLSSRLAPFEKLQIELERVFRSGHEESLDILLKDNSDAIFSLFEMKDLIYYNMSVPYLVRMLEILKKNTFSLSLSLELKPYDFTTPSFGLYQFQKNLKQLSDTGLYKNLSCKEIKDTYKSLLTKNTPQK